MEFSGKDTHLNIFICVIVCIFIEYFSHFIINKNFVYIFINKNFVYIYSHGIDLTYCLF